MDSRKAHLERELARLMGEIGVIRLFDGLLGRPSRRIWTAWNFLYARLRAQKLEGFVIRKIGA